MNRDLDIKDFLDNVRVKFSTCNAISYDFTFLDRNGEVKNNLRSSSTIENKDEMVEGIISTLENYLKSHTEIAKVRGDYGGRQQKQRTTATYIFRSNDDESKEQLRQQLDDAEKTMSELKNENEKLAENINKVKEANQSAPVDIAGTNYTQQTADTIEMFSTALLGFNNAKGLFGADGSISKMGMGVLMQVQEKRIKDDIERNSMLQKIESQKEEIATLKAQMAEMRREYERMEDYVEELEEYKRDSKPLLEEHKKLKTKSGLLGAGLGQALGAMLVGVASKSKYGAMLGLLGDDEQPSEEEYAEEEQNTGASVHPAEYDED